MVISYITFHYDISCCMLHAWWLETCFSVKLFKNCNRHNGKEDEFDLKASMIIPMGIKVKCVVGFEVTYHTIRDAI